MKVTKKIAATVTVRMLEPVNCLKIIIFRVTLMMISREIMSPWTTEGTWCRVWIGPVSCRRFVLKLG